MPLLREHQPPPKILITILDRSPGARGHRPESLPFLRIRKVYDEGRSLTFAPALSTYVAAVALDDIPNDGKTYTQTTVHAGREAAALPEAFEDVWQKLRIDTHSAIADTNVCPTRRVRQTHFDRTALAREFDRIRQQIPDYLLNSIPIAPDQ